MMFNSLVMALAIAFGKIAISIIAAYAIVGAIHENEHDHPHDEATNEPEQQVLDGPRRHRFERCGGVHDDERVGRGRLGIEGAAVAQHGKDLHRLPATLCEGKRQGVPPIERNRSVGLGSMAES